MDNYQGSDRHKESITRAREAASQPTECQHCHRGIVMSQFRKHVSACMYNPDNAAYCIGCNIRIFERRKQFCTKSCSATYYNNQREKRDRSFMCLSCGTEGIHGPTSLGRYCNNVCQQDHAWEIRKARIKNGDFDGVGRDALRRYLKEVHGYRCSDCGIDAFWNGKPLTLDMDHIDGNNSNNDPHNLRLLCPNCHTQTPTWGKKKRS